MVYKGDKRDKVHKATSAKKEEGKKHRSGTGSKKGGSENSTLQPTKEQIEGQAIRDRKQALEEGRSSGHQYSYMDEQSQRGESSKGKGKKGKSGSSGRGGATESEYSDSPRSSWPVDERTVDETGTERRSTAYTSAVDTSDATRTR